MMLIFRFVSNAKKNRNYYVVNRNRCYDYIYLLNIFKYEDGIFYMVLRGGVTGLFCRSFFGESDLVGKIVTT